MARSAILNVMVAAAMKAARGLNRDFGEVENLQVSRKGPADFVSAADHRAEEVIRAELAKARPATASSWRNPARSAGSDPQHRWIVDPLDGTTNFLHGIPQFAISIALERQGQAARGTGLRSARRRALHGRAGRRRIPERPAAAGGDPPEPRRLR